MGYTIELSFNARKHNNVTELKSHVNTIAYSYNCDRYYTIDEIGGVDILPVHGNFWNTPPLPLSKISRKRFAPKLCIILPNHASHMVSYTP